MANMKDFNNWKLLNSHEYSDQQKEMVSFKVSPGRVPVSEAVTLKYSI